MALSILEGGLSVIAKGGSGDMLKSTYDPNDDGVIAIAQLDTDVAQVSEIDDAPVNGELAAPISSNWAFDHAADLALHGGNAASRVVASSDASAREKAMADSVCDGTADNVEIQAALDAITTGEVLLVGSIFTIAAQVSIADGKCLRTLQGVKVKPSAAGVNGFLVHAGGSLRDLYWDSSAFTSSTSGTVVEFDGADHWYFAGRNSIVENITIWNGNTIGVGSIGFLVHADLADEYVCWARVRNFYSNGIETVIKFIALDLPSGLLAWCNGNKFHMGIIVNYKYAIWLNAEDAQAVFASVDANNFKDIEIQLTAAQTTAVYLQKGSHSNIFELHCGDATLLAGAGNLINVVDGMSNDFTIYSTSEYDLIANNKIVFPSGGSFNRAEIKGTYNRPSEVYEGGGELTIATGVITATAKHHTVDTESDAASDYLDKILGGKFVDQPLILKAAADARTVILRDFNTSGVVAGANIAMGGADVEFSLDSLRDTISFIWDGTYWNCVDRQSNA